MSWFEGLATRARLLVKGGAEERRAEEEIRFHLEMETERLMRDEGLSEGDARRRALVAFGGVDRTKEELRDGRGLAWLSGLRLDLKLGARTLAKYPVLTLASVLALTVALALAASWFQFMTNLVTPDLPLPGSERIVQVVTRDVSVAANRSSSLYDFERWRDEVSTIDGLSAAAPAEYAVTAEDGRLSVLEGARVSPDFFGVAGVGPAMGRPLAASDFDAAAPLAVVLGHSAWRRLLDGDPSAVGETVRLGSQYATVVGVMPEGFGFPVNQEVWAPLRESAVDYDPREGPPLLVVGRLAAGATVDQARAELEAVGRRVAAEQPTTHEHLRPTVNRFGRGSNMAGPARLLNLPFLFFLIVVSANVATLFFARTVTRQGEIAMRSALGASRRRIVAQLIAEALVLTVLAAVVALGLAAWGLGWGMELFWEVQQSRPPFWFDFGLSLGTTLYVLGLAVVAAVIIGGIPAIRSTGRRLRNRITQGSGAGSAAMRFGAASTAVIVAQVALCVAFIPIALESGRDMLPEADDLSFPAESFLYGTLVQQTSDGPTRTAESTGQESAGAPESAASAAPEVAWYDEVARRLAAESGVVAATFANRLPGFNHPVEEIQLEGDTTRVLAARRAAISPNFFDVMEARIVAGRSFRESDLTADQPVTIVDEEWAVEAFDGRSPIGRRIRYPVADGQEPRWYEIVGVVAGAQRALGPGEDVGLFQPLRPRRDGALHFYLRTDGRPAALVPQVNDMVAAVDPDFGIAELRPLEEVWGPVERSQRFFIFALAAVAALILLFALIGIYALTSFTVSRRAREIGIRAALGADPRRIVLTIFSRTLGQIAIGIVIGATLVSLTVMNSPEGIRTVIGVALAMTVVGLVGCVLPVRRALRVQPVEALRAD